MTDHTDSTHNLTPIPPPVDRQPRGQIAWDGGRAILLFILAAMVSVMAAMLLLEPLGFYGSIVVAEIVAFGVIPALMGVVFATGWRQWLGPPVAKDWFWLWAGIAVIAFAVAQSNLPVLLDRLYPIPEGQLAYLEQYLTADTPRKLLMVLLVAGLVPALTEEFTFRGVIQAGLRNSYGPKNAVIWSGLLFALLHLNPWNFLGLWSFGCFLGYLTERTGSIRPAMFLHLVNNSLALAVFSVQGKEQWTQRPEFIPWYWTLMAGAVLVFALWKVHRLTERDEESIFETAYNAPGKPDPNQGTNNFSDYPPV